MHIKFKPTYLFIFTIAAITTIYSCRKGLDVFSTEKQIVPPEAAWALTYYNQVLHPKEVNLNIQSKKSSSVSNNRLDILMNKNLLWKKATFGKMSGYSYVEIPIRFSTRMALSFHSSKGDSSVDEAVFKASFNRLIIYKDKSGVIYQKIISYVPDKDYLQRHNGDISHNRTGRLDNDFDGYIFHQEWNGSIMFALQLHNGRVVKQISVGTKLGKKKNQQTVSSLKCVTYPIYHIFQYCYYEGDNPDPIYCEPAQSEFCCEGEYCYNDNEGGENVDCTDPTFFDHPSCMGYYDLVDCAGVSGGSAIFDRKCGCIGGTTGKDSCPPCPTTALALQQTFPNAPATNMEKLNEVLNNYSAQYGLDTEAKMQHFIAQAAHESGGFQDLTPEESLYYTSAQRLVDVYPKRFSQTDPAKADPDDYLRDSEKLANFVYGERMGNGNAASGDGWRFRGRGIFQLTGRSNYRAFANAYSAVTGNDPNGAETIASWMSTEEEVSIVSALWYYQKSVLNKLQSEGITNPTVAQITKLINGGTNGLPDRIAKTTLVQLHIDC